MKGVRRHASIVTVDDLKNYFGKSWEGLGWKRGQFEGSSGLIDVKIEPAGVSYSVLIEAVEDPSDSEEIVTEKPLKAIAEFLGRDIPGSEHFEKMSTSPDAFANSLRSLASAVASGRLSRNFVSMALRRLATVPSIPPTSAPPSGQMELESMEKEMERKGWRVKKTEDKRGMSLLEVDVSGIYRAEVSVDSLLYKYSFGYRGHPDADDSGITEDPIRELEAWAKSPAVKEAHETAEDAREEEKAERSKKILEQRTMPSPEM